MNKKERNILISAGECNVDVETMRLIYKVYNVYNVKCFVDYLRHKATVYDVSHILHKYNYDFYDVVSTNYMVDGDLFISDKLAINSALNISLQGHFTPKVGKELADKYEYNPYIMEYFYSKFGDDLYKIIESVVKK